MTETIYHTPYALRISVELMAWVKAKAAEQERSANWVLTKIVEEAKKRDEEGRDGHPTP